MSQFVEKKFITQSNHTVSYIQSGQSNGQLTVLLHGLGGDAWAWHFLQQELQNRHIASVAVDLFGHGFSSRSNIYQDYELSKVSSDVVEFINSMNATEVILVGHCYGGMIAQLIAPQIHHCTKIIIIEAIFKWPTYAQWLLFGKLGERFFKLLGSVCSVKYILKRRQYDHVRYDFDYSPRVKINDFYYTSGRSWFYTFSQIFKFDNQKNLSKLSQKIYLIWGKKDLVFTYKNSSTWLEIFPHAKLVTLPSASHGAPLSHSADCATAIESFIQD